MTPVRAQFGSQGHGWQDLSMETIKHCYLLTLLAPGLSVSEKKLLKVL